MARPCQSSPQCCSQSPQRPNAPLLRAAQMESENWPASLNAWVRSAFAQCETNEERTWARRALRPIIKGAIRDGKLHETDWQAVPLPDLGRPSFTHERDEAREDGRAEERRRKGDRGADRLPLVRALSAPRSARRSKQRYSATLRTPSPSSQTSSPNAPTKMIKKQRCYSTRSYVLAWTHVPPPCFGMCFLVPRCKAPLQATTRTRERGPCY